MVANGIRNDRGIYSVSRARAENGNSDAPADFEKAISATGFGAYNIVLLLAAIPIGWASAFDMTTAAFLLASAECDLELTFIRKGALVAFVYIGMIVSSFFWGFVTDNASRRPLFILGLLADASLNILSSAIDSYYIFLLIKFITGTIISGPFALVIPYLAEFQPTAHRARVVAWTGFIFSIGNVIPAILAFTILPLPWTFTFLDRVFDSWRIYVLLCSIPSVLGLVTMSLIPESPKRLLAIGKPASALKIMKRMYSINTRNPPDTFPVTIFIDRLHKIMRYCNTIRLDLEYICQIRSLITETKTTHVKDKTNLEKMRDSWTSFKLLLQPPHRGSFFIINFLQFGSLLGFNTMRLWVPHMFIIMNNFDYTLWDPSRGKPTMCELLIPGVVPPGLDNPSIYANITDNCVRWNINPAVYINSTIIAASAVSFSFFIVMHLDTRIKKKMVLLSSFLLGTLGAFGANWSQLVPIMLSLCAAVAVTSRITGNIVIAVNANVIPVPLRATATSIVTTMGSLGTIVGNLIFSSLLGTNCVAAFMWLGASLILCIVVSLFALRPPPKPADFEPAGEPKTIVTRF